MASIAATVTKEVTKTITAAATSTSSASRAAPQGGVFEGLDPTHYDTKNPITLFIIQATIVIAFTRILHWPLSKLNQPRVIAEVITGIVLGPSVMGRIPGFTSHIFPTASMPAFSLAANLGLVMFLFLVGLEVDLRFLVSNWRIALSVGAAGMALPFGMGVGIAYGLYHQFRTEEGIEPISFGTYALFIGVALAITAFPVLCRILTSLKLLTTPVGVIVLSAGVGNDVVGWILLALCVALVNSGAGLTALYILLVAVGYSLFLAYPVRIGFLCVLRKTGSLQNGPTQGVVALTIFMVLASAFFTQIIGIHAIFGAFMVGLICPHEGGFAIKLTEKLEDLISTLFLPLYFALSGLSTNLGLLDNGITWAYVVAVMAIAFIGKIAGGTIASRLNGLVWRESLTIGCLMSCKGLVELIVLNIGLQARILSTRTFTIFVVMALITTFATTPLVVWLYPPWYQEKLELWKKGKIDWDGNPISPSEHVETEEQKVDIANRLLVYLRADGLSSLFSVIGLFTGGQTQHDRIQTNQTAEKHSSITDGALSSQNHDPASGFQRPLRIHGLRLMELTERNSSVMKVSEIEDFATRDPMIKAFGSSAHSTARDVTMSGQIAVVPNNSFADTLIQRAVHTRSDFLLVPWSETGSVAELHSPFDQINPDAQSDPLNNKSFSSLAADIFDQAVNSCAVGLFVDRSLFKRSGSTASSSSPVMERVTRQLSRTATGMSIPNLHENAGILFRSSDSRGRRQLRVLYTGTADDLYAVKLALQLAKTGAVEARIVHLAPPAAAAESSKSAASSPTTSDGAQALEDIRSNISEGTLAHVHFESLNAASVSDQVVHETLLFNRNDESGSVTVIVGRSVSTKLVNGDIALSASTKDKTNAFGAATALINHMKGSDVAASVLVVQAKASALSETQRPRKGSIHSEMSS